VLIYPAGSRSLSLPLSLFFLSSPLGAMRAGLKSFDETAGDELMYGE